MSTETLSPAYAGTAHGRADGSRRVSAARWPTVAGAVALAVFAAAATWLAFAAATSDWIIDTGNAPEPRWAMGPLAGVPGSPIRASAPCSR